MFIRVSNLNVKENRICHPIVLQEQNSSLISSGLKNHTSFALLDCKSESAVEKERDYSNTLM